MSIEQELLDTKRKLLRVMFKLEMQDIMNDCQDMSAFLGWITEQKITYSSDFFVKIVSIRIKARQYMRNAYSITDEVFISTMKEILTERNQLYDFFESEGKKIIKEIEMKAYGDEIKKEMEKRFNEELQKIREQKKNEQYEISNYIR